MDEGLCVVGVRTAIHGRSERHGSTLHARLPGWLVAHARTPCSGNWHPARSLQQGHKSTRTRRTLGLPAAAPAPGSPHLASPRGLSRWLKLPSTCVPPANPRCPPVSQRLAVPCGSSWSGGRRSLSSPRSARCRRSLNSTQSESKKSLSHVMGAHRMNWEGRPATRRASWKPTQGWIKIATTMTSMCVGRPSAVHLAADA